MIIKKKNIMPALFHKPHIFKRSPVVRLEYHHIIVKAAVTVAKLIPPSDRWENLLSDLKKRAVLDKAKDFLLLLFNVDDLFLLRMYERTTAGCCTDGVCLRHSSPAATLNTPKQPSVNTPTTLLQAECVTSTNKSNNLSTTNTMDKESQPGGSLVGHTVPVVFLAHRLTGGQGGCRLWAGGLLSW